MRIGYFDCFSGISGDMTLGALVDAGVDAGAIRSAVASLGLPVELSFETVRRGGFRATYARVEAAPEHAHRHLHHIEAIIEKGALSERQKDLARRIFTLLGESEARVHGIELKKVHFHEVGAIDSIVDIVGAAVGLDLLGVERFESSPVPPGRGFVKGAHGKMPLPAPRHRGLLKGVPLAASDIEMELTTPTGAAIVTTLCESFGGLPTMTVEAIGLGAGTRELTGQANILRLFVGRLNLSSDGDRVWVLETNLDDLPGEVVGYTVTQLMAAGALDAYVTPIQMKKNRPGVMVSVLCDEARIPQMEDLLFRETSTLGIRRYPVSRHKLQRRAIEVTTPFGTVKGKLGWMEGRPATFSPEYDDCARIAADRNVPLREVYDAAHAGYRATLTEGLVAPTTSKTAESSGRGLDEPEGHSHHH
ncbi:MAG: nickel pincer cofactor biosynthesis protein LarC [Isosphaeraceae bacterium]